MEALEYVAVVLVMVVGLFIYILPLLVVIIWSAENKSLVTTAIVFIVSFAIYIGLTMYAVDNHYDACVWFHGDEPENIEYCSKQ